jgi:hypothetical protein
MKLLTLFMVLFYLSFGLFLIFSALEFNVLTNLQRNILGILLILYAFYRAYRLYKNTYPL